MLQAREKNMERLASEEKFSFSICKWFAIYKGFNFKNSN